MNYLPINWALIRNPMNWVMVLLMLTIAAFALNEMMRYLAPNSPGSCGCSKNSLAPVPVGSNPSATQD